MKPDNVEVLQQIIVLLEEVSNDDPYFDTPDPVTRLYAVHMRLGLVLNERMKELRIEHNIQLAKEAEEKKT